MLYYDKWVAMENFYYTVFPTALFILSILIFVAVICGSNWHNTVCKRTCTLCCLAIGIIGTYTAYQYYVHADLIDKTRYLSATTRSFERKFYYDVRYTNREKDFFARAKLLEHFEQLGMYEHSKTSEYVEYLGRDAHLAYFNIEGKVFGHNIADVVFTDEVQQSERRGEFYSLNDIRFATELGFIPVSETYFINYHVPKALENLAVSAENEAATQAPSELIQRWIY